MKTVKLKAGHLIDGVHRNAGDVVLVVDEIATQLLKIGHAEIAPAGPVVNPQANRLADAVNPLVPDADPLHGARALGLQAEDHPGLVALADAGHPGAQRTGRIRPATSTEAAAAAAAAKPAPAVAKP